MRGISATMLLLTGLSHPSQLRDGLKAQDALETQSDLKDVYANWPVPLTSLDVIANCQQPMSRDWSQVNHAHTVFASCGTYSKGLATVPDLGITFRYPPGTMIMLSGALRLGVEVTDGDHVMFKAKLHSTLLDAAGVSMSGPPTLLQSWAKRDLSGEVRLFAPHLPTVDSESEFDYSEIDESDLAGMEEIMG